MGTLLPNLKEFPEEKPGKMLHVEISSSSWGKVGKYQEMEAGT